MNWSDVGGWIKDNAGTSAALIGSLLTGNVPSAVAAGVSLVSSATGTNDPSKALHVLQQDPAAMAELQRLAHEERIDIRRHIETMERLRLEDEQKEHEQQQQTIRGGDTALDAEIRRTRPRMARQSWVATLVYAFICIAGTAMGKDLFNIWLAGILSTPAWAYLGLRTGDKFALAFSGKEVK